MVDNDCISQRLNDQLKYDIVIQLLFKCTREGERSTF